MQTVSRVEAKEIKRFFARVFKDVSNHSPFAIPRTDEIENALSREGALVECDAAGRIVACALLAKLKAASTQRDFTQRVIKVPAGAHVVSHVAVAPDCPTDIEWLFQERLAETLSPFSMIEVYEEHARSISVVDELPGFYYVATKVTAYGEVKGLYVDKSAVSAEALFAPAKGVYPLEETATLVELAREYITEEQRWTIREELARWLQVDPDSFEPHYSIYNKNKTWSALALRGYSYDPAFIIKPAEMTNKWKKENAEKLAYVCSDTHATQFFPRTMEIVNALPGVKQRVRLMKLGASGGELQRHCDIQDKEAGVADGMIARLHIPLVTSEAVLFSTWDIHGVRREFHMKERSLNYLDVRKPHAAINVGDAARIHLVVDVHSTEELRRMIRNAALSCA